MHRLWKIFSEKNSAQESLKNEFFYSVNEGVEKPDFRKKSRRNLLVYKCAIFAF